MRIIGNNPDADNAEITAVASGTLANGSTVIVNTDGTVSVVAETTISDSVGSAALFTTSHTGSTAAAYDTNAQRIVIAYRDDGDSGRGKLVVGEVSGTSISFGSVVTLLSGFNPVVVSYVSAVYDSNAQKVIVAWRNGSESDRGYAVVTTVDNSNNSISFGSLARFEFGNTSYIGMAYDSSAQKVVIAFTDDDNSNYGKVVVATVSGTSISYGTAVVFESASTRHSSPVYDANTGKIVIAYQDLGNSNCGTAIVGTVSGTSISFGSSAVFNSGNVSEIAAVYDPDAQKVVIVGHLSDYPNSRGIAHVGTVSGTSISFGTVVVFQSGTNVSNNCLVYDTNAKKVVISYRVSSNGYGKVVAGTVSGTSISFGSVIALHDFSIENVSSAYDSNEQRVVTAFEDQGNGSYTAPGAAVVSKTGFVTTNLTSENFIGFSNAAYANTQTATIEVGSAINNGQSSLTIGQQYFVQTNGTIGTTAADPSVIAGTAISATEIIVKG